MCALASSDHLKFAALLQWCSPPVPVYSSLTSAAPYPLHRQVRDCWQTYQLELINYQNKCKLIRGWDDLFTKVKEHINSLAAMKLSPYYKVQLLLVWVGG